MIWVAGRSPTLVSHSLRGVATNLKATTLAYLAIDIVEKSDGKTIHLLQKAVEAVLNGAKLVEVSE
jgi:hypothetical protein